MVAGDRDDRRGVVVVRLVELIVIIGDLAVKIDDVSQVVEEPRGVLLQVQVPFHGVGNGQLEVRVLDAPGITARVKDELADRLGIILDARDCRLERT